MAIDAGLSLASFAHDSRGAVDARHSRAPNKSAHANRRLAADSHGLEGKSMRIRSFIAPASAVLIAVAFGTGAFAQAAKDKKGAPKNPAPAPQTQQQPAQQPQQSQQAVVVPSPWTKRCVEEPTSKKKICEIAQALFAETGQFLMSATIQEMQDNPRKGMTIVTPMGMLLPPGVRIHIDHQQLPNDIPYIACVMPPSQPPGCIAELEIDNNFINLLKKSQTMRVQVINGQRRTIDFVFTTKDFGKAYDGAAVDEKAMAAQREKLKEELQKRAADALKNQPK
jgi:invasion protein IalB